MPRDLAAIQAGFAASEDWIGKSAVTELAPGYRYGFRIKIDSVRNLVSIRPGIANVAGQRVAVNETTVITDEEWTTDRVAETHYYIYLAKTGEFFVAPTPPSYDELLSAYYHPDLGHLGMGRVFVDSNKQVIYASNEYGRY